MNKVIMMGRITRDIESKYYQNGAAEECMIRTGIAVNRIGQKDKADFFNIAAFGKRAEWFQKYAKKGTKLLITGRIQNDTYKNKEGQTVNSVQILVEEAEFAESKKFQEQQQNTTNETAGGFMDIPTGDGEELPFN